LEPSIKPSSGAGGSFPAAKHTAETHANSTGASVEQDFTFNIDFTVFPQIHCLTLPNLREKEPSRITEVAIATVLIIIFSFFLFFIA